MINKFFPFVLLFSMFSLLGTFQDEILVNLISQSSKVLTDFEGIKRLETQQVEGALSKLESQKYFPENALTYNIVGLEFINFETAKEEAPMNTINGAFLLQYILDVHRFRERRNRENPSYLIVDKVIKCSESVPLGRGGK